MEKKLKVTCPCCDTILIVDRLTGKLLETRKPLIKESTGDRFKDAFIKVKQDKEKHTSLFDNMQEKQEQKKRLAEDLFNASLKDAKNDKNKKPHSIFDAD